MVISLLLSSLIIDNFHMAINQMQWTVEYQWILCTLTSEIRQYLSVCPLVMIPVLVLCERGDIHSLCSQPVARHKYTSSQSAGNPSSWHIMTSSCSWVSQSSDNKIKAMCLHSDTWYKEWLEVKLIQHIPLNQISYLKKQTSCGKSILQNKFFKS